MAIAITLPSVSPAPGDTIVGQYCVFGFEKTGGAQVNFRAKIASLSSTVEKIERKAAVSGLLEVDRTVVTSIKWMLKLTLDEFSAAYLVALNDPYQVGTGRIWIEDPDDAANTVSLMSNVFNCTVSPDGDSTFQADQFSECGLMVDINGTFSMTRDEATV